MGSTKKILQWIIFLSLIGLAASLYLVKNHYAAPQSGALCDIGKTVSCSIVNTSTFSELFNVPVALFGELWFFTLLIMSWKALKRSVHLPKIMRQWSLLGLIFVGYMIIAEVVLKAICPLCTVVHVLVLVIFLLSRQLHRLQEEEPYPFAFLKARRKWMTFIGVIFVIPILMFNLASLGDENYDQLAQCLSEKGISFYSSYHCGYCLKTKEMFGDSMKFIKEIECHPDDPHSQFELCQQKNIEGTPTWVMEIDGGEIKRQEGFMNIEALKEFSGCR